jgi:hypothetical protein
LPLRRLYSIRSNDRQWFGCNGVVPERTDRIISTWSLERIFVEGPAKATLTFQVMFFQLWPADSKGSSNNTIARYPLWTVVSLLHPSFQEN